jgi:integrase
MLFPSPKGRYWRSSNFNRRILKPAFLAAGRRDGSGGGSWTWHSLRHVFCTTALFTWKLDTTDVSRMAGHSNYRVTLDMYVGATADVLDRARAATE